MGSPRAHPHAPLLQYLLCAARPAEAHAAAAAGPRPALAVERGAPPPAWPAAVWPILRRGSHPASWHLLPPAGAGPRPWSAAACMACGPPSLWSASACGLRPSVWPSGRPSAEDHGRAPCIYFLLCCRPAARLADPAEDRLQRPGIRCRRWPCPSAVERCRLHGQIGRAHV